MMSKLTFSLSFPDESMDVDPNYDPSDFLKLASSIKKERPDHDQPMHHDDDDHQQHLDQQASYDDPSQYDGTALQPHQMKAEMQPYEMQQTSYGGDPQQQPMQLNDYGDGVALGQHMYQNMDGEQQQPQYMVYADDDQLQHQQEYGQPVMMNVSDNLVYQNVDENGRVVVQQQANNDGGDEDDDGLGVGIDDDLAVSDSDDEAVPDVGGGDPPQQVDATVEPEPAPPPVVMTKQEVPLDVEADDDGGDLWF